MSIGFFGSFMGGLLTLLSPCSVMLLPAFFAYAFNSAGQIFARTAVFFAGLATTLVPLGMLAGSLGSLIQRHRTEVVTIASIIVIVLGIVMLLGVPIPGLARAQSASSTSIASVYALGTIYGVAGVCAGPLLGAVLTFAGASGDPLMGGLLLLFFAAGMAFPLLILALFWNSAGFVKKLVKPREFKIGKLKTTVQAFFGGLLTIAIGVVLLVTDGTASLGSFLGASEQFAIESDFLRFSKSVPNWLFIIISILVLALVFFMAKNRNREQDKI